LGSMTVRDRHEFLISKLLRGGELNSRGEKKQKIFVGGLALRPYFKRRKISIFGGGRKRGDEGIQRR